LKAEHEYFKYINSIITDLKKLSKQLNKQSENFNDSNITEEKLDIAQELIDRVIGYYHLYIEKVIEQYGYGSTYRQQFNTDKEYLIALSDLAAKKTPIFSREAIRLVTEDGIDAALSEEAYEILTISRPETAVSQGTHAVVEYDGVRYKYIPYAPGIEFAVNNLYNIILDNITPPVKLIKLYNQFTGESAIYLASKAIDGMDLQYVLQNPVLLNKIDMENFSAIVIASLLTSSGDAKLDNFMVRINVQESGEVDNIKIISVANDISFCDGVPELNRLAEGNKVYPDMLLNVLYLFPQMDEKVSNKLKAEFLADNFVAERIVSEWLGSLWQQNNKYYDMLNHDFTHQDLELLKLPIYLREGTAGAIYHKLANIIHILERNEYVTHNTLFKKLYPEVSEFYQQIKENHHEIFDAIKQLYAADDEEMAEDLQSKILSPKQFKSIFRSTIEHEASNFISVIDFSKFNPADNAIFYILSTQLNYVRKLTLHNINADQLKKLLFGSIDTGIKVNKFHDLQLIKLINCNIDDTVIQTLGSLSGMLDDKIIIELWNCSLAVDKEIVEEYLGRNVQIIDSTRQFEVEAQKEAVNLEIVNLDDLLALEILPDEHPRMSDTKVIGSDIKYES